MTTLTLPITEVLETTERVLRALGTPPKTATEVAASLVGANQVGHDSHGIVRLLEYASFVERGLVIPDASPFIVSEFGAVRVVDGAHGWGQRASHFAVDLLSEVTGDTGVATVTLRNCNHIGRLGEYAEMLAERGLCSLIWCNADPSVAPFGGRERKLGTNPLAAGIPVAGADPVILDFATAAIAEGKVRVARATGHSVESGAIIDSEGRPSVVPDDFYSGGALLPFGAHKGYGLSVLIELLGGALSGNHPSATSRYETGNGVVMIAFRIEAFAPADAFAADVVETVAALRSSVPIDPARPVMVPGDIEASTRLTRATELPIAEEIWQGTLTLLDRLVGRANG